MTTIQPLSSQYGTSTSLAAAISTRVTPSDSSIRDLREAVGQVGDRLESAEAKLLGAFKTGDEAAIQKATITYQKWQRVMATLSELSRNMHDMIMRLVSNLRLN